MRYERIILQDKHIKIVGWLVNDELEGMWQEEFVTSFKILQRHLPGETEKQHKNLSQCRTSLNRDLSLVSPEYGAEMQTFGCVSSVRDGVLFSYWLILQPPIAMVHLVCDESERKFDGVIIVYFKVH